MRVMCVEVDRDDDRWRPFTFTFTLYRIYEVWQNAVNQLGITDDEGNGWRLIRCPDGSYKLNIVECVVFIEVPE